MFVVYPCRVGGSAHVNGGLWSSAAPSLPAGKLPQSHGSEKLSEDSSVQEKDADSKCVGITESKK